MIDYASILDINYPGTQWAMQGMDYEGITWMDESPKPTKEELDALWESTQIALKNREASENRKRAYAQESDPLFFKAQRGEATQEEWLALVEEIKNRYPKVGA